MSLLLLSQVLIFFGFLTFTPAQYGDYVFPEWANILGWAMTGTSLLCIVVYAIGFLIFKAEGGLVEVGFWYNIVCVFAVFCKDTNENNPKIILAFWAILG